MSYSSQVFADGIVSTFVGPDLVKYRYAPHYVNKYIINISNRERLQEGGILYWKFLKSPPLNRAMNDMFQGIFRDEDICKILELPPERVSSTEDEIVSLYRKMLYLPPKSHIMYIIDPVASYHSKNMDIPKDVGDNDNIYDTHRYNRNIRKIIASHFVTIAKICHNLRPYGVSSILCDETGKLSHPIPETNQANILVKGSVVDDKNGFHSNDTLRIPRSKIISPNREIPAFDRRCKIGTLFAVLVPDHRYDETDEYYDLRFKISYIATRRVSIDHYCSKRLYAYIKLGTFRCVGVSDCRKDIYSYKATNQTEEHTYFPNFVFGPANQWVLPPPVKLHRADIHRRLYSHGLSRKLELIYDKRYGRDVYNNIEDIYPLLFEKLSIPGFIVSCLEDPYLPTTFVQLPSEIKSPEAKEEYRSIIKTIGLNRRRHRSFIEKANYTSVEYIKRVLGEGEEEENEEVDVAIPVNEESDFTIDTSDEEE